MQSAFSWAPKVARKSESKHWYACGADGRAAGGRCTVTWLPNFLGWVDLLTHGAWYSASALRAPELRYNHCHLLRPRLAVLNPTTLKSRLIILFPFFYFYFYYYHFICSKIQQLQLLSQSIHTHTDYTLKFTRNYTSNAYIILQLPDCLSKKEEETKQIIWQVHLHNILLKEMKK